MPPATAGDPAASCLGTNPLQEPLKDTSWTCPGLVPQAPYHCESLLSGACGAALCALRSAAGHAAVGSDALARPLISCVDGANLEGSSVACLHEYLLRSLAMWPVDWPAAVRGLLRCAPCVRRCVDYGPGGGAGAAKMSRQAAAEEEGVTFEYYTQLVRPGPLPQSWLAWLKLEEEREGGGPCVVDAPS